MNKEEIKTILPHREPMLLLDSVEKTEDGKALGKYKVKGTEFFLQGHFPNQPIVPGVIQCEMMAQACCVLIAEKETDKTKIPYFTGITDVKFKNKIVPYDIIEIECEIEKEKKPFYFAKGNIKVNGKLCTKGKFSFAII